MSHRHFYEHLGRLAYALIAIDGTVDAAEVERCRTAIRNFVGRHTEFTHENNSAEALIVLVSFDHAVALRFRPHDILSGFEAFAIGPATKHISSLFLDEAYRLLLRAAATYKGVNEVEQELLNRIEKVFEKTWKWKKQA